MTSDLLSTCGNNRASICLRKLDDLIVLLSVRKLFWDNWKILEHSINIDFNCAFSVLLLCIFVSLYKPKITTRNNNST